jgi:HAE1 family hydrophobic/amphiphilic exporter-1
MLAARWIKRPKHDNDYVPTVVDPHSELDSEKVDHEQLASDAVTLAHEGEQHSSKNGWVYGNVDSAYTWLLRLSMRFRWVVVLLCVITVASIYPLFRYVGMAFLPDEDESAFQISVRGPQGTSLAATQSILDRIARDIRQRMPGVRNTVVNAGGFGGGGGGNSGNISVNLVPVSERKQGQAELINRARQMVRPYGNKDWRINASASSSIAQGIGLGRGGSGIGYYISGPDMEQLNKYADTLVEKMKQDPTFRDPDNSVDVGTPEVRFVIDRTKAADLGVNATDISRALNIAAAGQRVSTFNEGTQQYDVLVQADEPFRRSRNNLQFFTVASTNGAPVGLDRLVRIEEARSPSSIARLNRQRVVTISSSLPPGASESDALTRLQQLVGELNLPAEYSSGVQGQSKELQRAYSSFLYAFLLSFVFMYLILAAQFESFIHPVTILLTLPLSVPFALLSTAMAGQTLNIFSALGILLLFGIVKKNAILQIDHTNTLRSHGMNRYDAIIQANRDRLRPILMTTMALVAGMIPLILGSGAGAATNRSIGILVVGGQSMCLLLTLLAVPVFYSLFDDASEATIFHGLGVRYNNFKTVTLRPAVERLTASFRRKKREKPEADVDPRVGGETLPD